MVDRLSRQNRGSKLVKFGFLNNVAEYWNRENGYRHILKIAFPLVLSTGSWSIQQFVDRMFLSWYSTDALAAAMPAAILSFTVTSIFLGTAGYVGTFVAQYIGAGRPHRVGPVMWQGIYFSLFGGILVTSTFFLAEPIFNFINHEPKIRALEIEYWKYLSIGGGFTVGIAAISSFYNGRGKTYPVMWASFAATLVNVILNYLLIFGNYSFPEMGIAGAGLSTIVSQFVNLLILLIPAFSGSNNVRFNMVSGWRFDPHLFHRLIKFGLPTGVQFFLDIAAFSVFLLLVGKLGTAELAATNIAFNVSMLSFMPLMGAGITVSILVGQSLGANKPHLAHRATTSTLQMAFAYMGTVAALYLFLPSMFIYPFAANAEPIGFEAIRVHAMTAMKFVAAWSICDALGVVVSSALKGAGDTAFIMYAVVGLSTTVLIIPTYIVIEIMEMGLEVAWSLAVAYILSLGIVFQLRYRTGKWRTMRVIERTE